MRKNTVEKQRSRTRSTLSHGVALRSGPLGALGILLLSVLTATAVAAQDRPEPMAAEGAVSTEEDAALDPTPVGEFVFGSYGRVMAATDLRGGRGKRADVVSFGPRLEEEPYLETDLRYDLRLGDDRVVRTLVTLALVDALFHFDGDFDGQIALRNAYVEASGLLAPGLSLWAGSRMLRGDDIYLLDFWPLDNLNTVGGGASVALETGTRVGVHVGISQLDDPFQRQEILVPTPAFGAEPAIFNDRVRLVTSGRVEQIIAELPAGLSAKVVGYGELHAMDEGQFRDEADNVFELPSERGYTLGLQLGVWGFGPDSFANLFFRVSRGIAAYGELVAPSGLSLDLSAADAALTRLGLSFNVERGTFGVLGGAYAQWFVDSDDVELDNDDYFETAFALRPMLFVGEHFRQAFEASYQMRRPNGLSARTDTFLVPAIWKLAVMPTIAPNPGSYSRPELRVVYSASFLNKGARALFADSDPRQGRDIHHFLGVGAEWWFNSSSYQ